MNSLFQEFHNKNWRKLSVDQRFEVIQKLEEYYAKQQGRNACQVVAIEDEESLGYYYQNKIHINKTKLLQDETAYEAVNTVIHEGRHAFQEYALKNSPSQISQEELNKWKVNFTSGYLNSVPDYWFQAIEKDANDYAFAETDKIFAELEKELGECTGYFDYKETWDMYFQDQAKGLKYDYGDDYQQVINEKVDQKYNLTQMIANDKEFDNQKAWLLNDDIENFIHQTYPNQPTVNDFKSYLEQEIQNKGYKELTDYLEDLEKNKKVQNRAFGQIALIDQPTLPISTLEKMDQVHALLTQQINETKASEIHPNLVNNIDTFTKAVQTEFQKQYPDLELKPFHLSSSKFAIAIMKHNSETGQILSPDQFKELGFKQVDINKIVDQDKKYELER